MKLVTGIVLIAIGTAMGLYVGIWWAFIGGIIEIVEAIRSEALDGTKLALGIARIVFAAPIGYAAAALLIVPGYFVVVADDKDKHGFPHL